MGSSYPTAKLRPLAPDTQGPRPFTLGPAANDNTKGVVRRAPMALVPANDNAPEAVQAVKTARSIVTAITRSLRSNVYGMAAQAALEYGWTVLYPKIFEQPEEVVWSLGGWTGATVWICPGGGTPTRVATTQYGSVAGSNAANCIGNQAVSGSGNNLRRGFWRLTSPGRYSHVRSYHNTAGQSGAGPSYEVIPPRPAQSPVYGLVPMALPRPAPVYRPRTTERIESDSAGPAPAPRPSAGARPRPPGRGTKEVKMTLTIGGLPGKLIGNAGETIDFIEALHDALPKDCQAKAKRRTGIYGYGRPRKANPEWMASTPYEKAIAIYNCINRIDVSQAIINLITNQVEDYLIGKVGKAAGKAARKQGTRPVSAQFGPAL